MKIISIICLLFMSKLLLAQEHIVFIQQQNGKIIQAKLGDQLSIKYRGYLGQTETFKQTLTAINDSSFVLGFQFLGQELNAYKKIKYQDIIAFRRIGLGRTILKTSLSLGSAVGLILLLDRTYKNETFNLGLGGRIGLSVGLGMGMSLLINGILPEKPNHFVKDGWQIYSVMK
jgi:hypothetical protein